MPRSAASLPAAALLSLLAVTHTIAADLVDERLQVIDAWAVATLGDGEGRVYRALNASDYSDAYLAVNYPAGVCDLPDLQMRVTLEETQQQDEVVNLAPTEIRVDRQQVHNAAAEFATRAGDDGFYARFYVEDQPELLREMRRGEVVRLRFEGEEENYWYMEFSLYGADQALRLAADQCRRSSQQPQDFFD